MPFWCVLGYARIISIFRVMNQEVVASFPYSAITISILARFIFMYLLYKNKSKNNYSLTFCILNIGSSSLWLAWSVYMNDVPMLARSSTEIILLMLSSLYIVKNKVVYREPQVLPV
jgi:uncharacterized protein with PQ loop repeat